MTGRGTIGVAVLLGLTLAACQHGGAPLSQSFREDACGAQAMTALIGQPASVLQTMRFGGPVRIIHAGMAVTMDYNPERLNIEIGADGTIARLHCS